MSLVSDTRAIGRTPVQLFREAKVDEFEVALGVNEDVLGLQVSICDPLLLVQELEYQTYFGGIEASRGLLKASISSEI